MLVALTGGIASGKTTVKKRLLKHRIPVIDLDEIAHLASDDQVIIEQVQKTLGYNLKTERQQLGAYIVSNDKAKQQLEAILHPYVYNQMELQIQQLNDPIIVVDVPLLYETNKQSRFDQVVVVYVDENTQIRRLMKRNQCSIQEAKKWIQAQMPLAKKAALADVVINNNVTIEALYHCVDQLVAKWKGDIHANNGYIPTL